VEEYRDKAKKTNNELGSRVSYDRLFFLVRDKPLLGEDTMEMIWKKA